VLAIAIAPCLVQNTRDRPHLHSEHQCASCGRSGSTAS
jgi:hypothetical protein